MEHPGQGVPSAGAEAATPVPAGGVIPGVGAGVGATAGAATTAGAMLTGLGVRTGPTDLGVAIKRGLDPRGGTALTMGLVPPELGPPRGPEALSVPKGVETGLGVSGTGGAAVFAMPRGASVDG